jgi:hypothetical protein
MENPSASALKEMKWQEDMLAQTILDSKNNNRLPRPCTGKCKSVTPHQIVPRSEGFQWTLMLHGGRMLGIEMKCLICNEISDWSLIGQNIFRHVCPSCEKGVTVTEKECENV